MELKTNEKYELEVIDICNSSNGYDYFLALGPDDKTYYVFNILKFQYLEVPKYITCIVTGFDIKGRARMKQDECALIQDHYKLNNFYAFSIADKKDDRGKTYYIIEDDFCIQRWYSEEEYSIGDDIILKADAYTNGGYIHYIKHRNEEEQSDGTNKIKETNKKSSRQLPQFDGGDESLSLEYKTSIVFSSKNNEPEIDKQMFTIVRSIVSFMNAQGGTLYIGIHDKTHKIIGIDKDLRYLNSGESTNEYSEDYDHYQLKIRDELVSYCGGVAGSLVDISFPSQEGVTYCQINISPAKRPIWCKGNMLFQRQGNQVQMLKGEALTQFVGERIGSYILSMAKEENSLESSQEDISAIIHDALKAAINDRRKSVAANIQPANNKTIKYWLVWYNDGTYIKSKEQLNDSKIIKQLSVTDETANLIVAFCHKSGTLNIVRLGDFMKGVNQKKAGRNGFNPLEMPSEIYICHPTDLLAIHSADSGGTEYIKIHHLSDVNSTSSGKNQGAFIIPKDKGHVLNYKLIDSAYTNKLTTLIAKKSDTTKSFGSNMYDINIQKELSYLGFTE